jgi:hypothetical protein
MKLLSKRVQFVSVPSFVDDYLPQFQKHFNLTDDQTVQLRKALCDLFEHLLWEASFAAKLGAEKGIAEAFSLMKDPDYYETVKKRKQKQRLVRKQQREDISGKKLITDLLQ